MSDREIHDGQPDGTMNSNLNIMDLSNILHSLGSSRRTGTLKVVGPEGAQKWVYFDKGLVAHIHVDGETDIIGTALFRAYKIDEEALGRARGAAETNGGGIGEFFIEEGWVSAEEITDALGRQTSEEMCEIFTWPDITCEFYEGEPLEDVFTWEELVYPLTMNPDLLVIESARRQDEWTSIARVIPSARDVYTATPKSFTYMNSEDEETMPERELLGWIDGVLDVEEVIERARLSRFQALKVMAQLAEEGAIEPILPLQLIQLAFDLSKEGNVKKCLRLYERSEELGVDQWDLSSRIARAYETMGDNVRAAKSYIDFAQRCLGQRRYDEAIHTLQKVIVLQPNNFGVHEKLVNLLMEQDRREEALRELSKLIGKLEQEGGTDRLIRAWQKVVLLAPDNLDAYGNLATLYQAAGLTAQAMVEFDGLARKMMEDGRPDDAIQVYRQILQIDPESQESMLALATVLTELGRNTEAVKELIDLSRHLSRSEDENRDALIEVHEKIATLEPDNKASREWLANAYADRSDSDKAVAHFRGIAQSLHRAGKLRDAISPLQRIVELRPTEKRGRKELARAYCDIGETATAAQVLHTLADQIRTKKNPRACFEIYEEILRISPFDLRTHKGLAELYLSEKANERALAKYLMVAKMCNHVGLHDEAEDVLKKAAELGSDNPEISWELAEVLRADGRNLEAARQLIKFARAEIERKNFGRAQDACDRIREIDPENTEVEIILKDLSSRDAMLAGRLNLQPTGLSEPAPWAPAATIPAAPVSPAKPVSSGPVRTGGSVAGIAAKMRSLNRPGVKSDRPQFKKGDGAKKASKVSSPADKLRAMKAKPEADSPVPAAASTEDQGPAKG
ncbi:MAG: tetratricopeptide repeat protein [Planctomycetota bacterium]|nr:tetratricopeptide repeat protein [Planctomycetota bacterium]